MDAKLNYLVVILFEYRQELIIVLYMNTFFAVRYYTNELKTRMKHSANSILIVFLLYAKTF